MDKQEIVPCDVCGAEATRFYKDTAASLCEYHAEQYEAKADLEVERQQEDAELDNE